MAFFSKIWSYQWDFLKKLFANLASEHIWVIYTSGVTIVVDSLPQPSLRRSISPSSVQFFDKWNDTYGGGRDSPEAKCQGEVNEGVLNY